jgi:hypothetical protein
VNILPKIVKEVDDFSALEFKKFKTFIKKDLARLESKTEKNLPTDFILIGNHTFSDKLKEALPLLIFGRWKPPIKAYVKKEVIKKMNQPDYLVGEAYYAGEEDGQKIIQLSIWKGKGKEKKFKIGLNKLLPSGYILRYENVAKEETSNQPIETISYKDPLDSLRFGEVYSLTKAQKGVNTDGEQFDIPIGSEIGLITKGDASKPTKFLAVIDGEFLYFELPNDELLDKIVLPISTIEVKESSHTAINRLRDIKRIDWASYIDDAASDKIAYLLKSFNKAEQQIFIEQEGLKYFANYELGAQYLITAIEDWDIPLIDKLRLLEEEGKLSYENYRRMFVNADLTGFDIKKHFNLLPFSTRIGKNVVQFCKEVGLDAVDKKWLQDKVLNGIHPDKVKITEPFYDDMKDSNRAIKIDAAQLEVINRIESLGHNRASIEDKKKTIEWFQKNALAETFALLDISEKQIQGTLNRYAGQLYQSFKKEYEEVLNSPYADGHYTFKNALKQRGNDAHSHAIAQRELKKTIQHRLGTKYPIVHIIDDFTSLLNIIESKDEDKLQNYLEDALIDRLENITETRTNLREDPELIWNLKSVVENTFGNLGINPTSPIGQIIVTRQQEYKDDQLFISLALAALSVGLGILGAFATGGMSLLVSGSALAVGAYDFSRELSQYQMEEAAANTSLLKAEALSQEQPDFLWVAIAGLGVLGDAGAVVKVLKNIKIGALTKVDDVERYTDEVAQLLAKEKGIVADATNPNFQQLRNLVKAEAIEQLARADRAKDVSKQMAYERLKLANQEFLELGKRFNDITGVLPAAVVKLTKVFKEAVTLGAVSMKEAFGMLDKNINGLLKKYGIEITDPKIEKQFETLFEEALKGVKAKQQKIEAAFDGVDKLRGMPIDKIYDNQAGIEKVWADFLEETPPPKIKLNLGSRKKPIPTNIEIKFDDNGNFAPVDSAGNLLKLNVKQKKDIYKALGLDHASKNHSTLKGDRELAVRTLTNNNAQSSKYKNDQIFIMCCEMAKKKCFDAQNVFDAPALLKTGVVKKSDKSYEFILPLPKGYGTVYVNLNHSKINEMPSWVKKGKTAFPNDQGLQDVVEIPMTELLVIFDTAGEIVTTYGRGFPTLK